MWGSRVGFMLVWCKMWPSMKTPPLQQTWRTAADYHRRSWNSQTLTTWLCYSSQASACWPRGFWVNSGNLAHQMVCSTEPSGKVLVKTVCKKAETVKKYVSEDWQTNLWQHIMEWLKQIRSAAAELNNYWKLKSSYNCCGISLNRFSLEYLKKKPNKLNNHIPKCILVM